MGTSASIIESKSQLLGKESVLSEGEDEFNSAAISENFLRLTILENIQLEFQRPTVVLLYGCPHSCVDSVSQFLSKKLKYEIIKGEIDQPLNIENLEFINQKITPILPLSSTSLTTTATTTTTTTTATTLSSSSPPTSSRITKISNYGKLFQNYPQTFEQVLQLQSLIKGSQIVVIFLNSSYANIIRNVQMEWIHSSSGRVYNTIKSPPKSMTGLPNNPCNMFDDITNEPLIQKTTREQCIRDLMAYDKMKIEMWSQWVSFRHCINADVDQKILEHELTKLMCSIIADQSSGLKRVITTSGSVKVRSTNIGIG